MSDAQCVRQARDAIASGAFSIDSFRCFAAFGGAVSSEIRSITPQTLPAASQTGYVSVRNRVRSRPHPRSQRDECGAPSRKVSAAAHFRQGALRP